MVKKDYIVETSVTFVDDKGNYQELYKLRETVSGDNPAYDLITQFNKAAEVIQNHAGCTHEGFEYDQDAVWCIFCGENLTWKYEQDWDAEAKQLDMERRS